MESSSSDRARVGAKRFAPSFERDPRRAYIVRGIDGMKVMSGEFIYDFVEPFNHIAHHVEEHIGSIMELRGDTAFLARKIDNVDNKVTKLDDNVTKLDDKVTKFMGDTNTRFEKMEGRMENMERILKALEFSVEAIALAVKARVV